MASLLPKSRKARRRLYVVAAAAPVVAVAAGLAAYALGDTAVFFYSPAQAQAKHVPAGRTVRIGGLVRHGSVAHEPDGLVSFAVTDMRATDRVEFRGDLPDLFREGQGVVAQGAFRPDGVFEAREVLAKHDERYMPKEVADALKKSGEWRPDAQVAIAPLRDGAGGPLGERLRLAMTAELGQFALILALSLSLLQVAAGAAARIRRDASLRGAAEGAAAGAALAAALAFFSLMHAFVTSDFSVANVAANSHTDKPWLYKVAATWGSHEGSMLLWNLALTGFGAAVALGGRGLPGGLKSLVLAVQGGLGVLFLGYTAFASNPFVRAVNPPVEGASLNPILQDPFLAIHPPFLYAGYVGFSVVFSFALAALIEGRVDAAWARWVRPWTLAAWSFLTVGITLGSFWAYYSLGWGGWWFWDPVENASFMPWLVGTALLHSAVVSEKRGALLGWTAFLAIAAFTLSMLGAFLVRSGVLTSVHAFAVDPTRGTLLLVILGLAAGTGFALFAWRAPAMRGGGLFAVVSREGALVLNNIFLAAAAATVLMGTLYPLVRQALSGEAISVGAPYFALTFGPLMGACLVVLPFGPLLAWKRGDLAAAAASLRWAALAAVVVALAGLALMQPRRIPPLIGLILGAWLVVGTLTEVAWRVRLGRAPWAEVRRRAGGLPRGSWGATLAHIGLGVFVLGACTEISLRVEAAGQLSPGQSLRVAGYVLTLDGVSSLEGPNYIADRARFTVHGPGGRVLADATPERRFYPVQRQTVAKVALQQKGVSDLYVVLGERGEATGAAAPKWTVRAFWNPWARLIFYGPLLMGLGGALSLSDRRLRLAAGARARATSPVLAPSLTPAE